MAGKKKKKNRLTPFGKAVKKRLIDKGIQHQQLADEVGTTVKYLDHIIYGRRKQSMYIPRIAAALSLNLEKYMTLEGKYYGN